MIESKKNNDKKDLLVELIDKLTPFNNNFRQVNDPVEKIEIMWQFGEILNNYIIKTGIKLHSLLYKIYDPYSTIKFSNITRDLGSNSYRIYKYFKSKEEIKKRLFMLKNYSTFRESIPLLFNPKYKLDESSKKKVINLITSGKNTKLIIKELKKRKQEIVPMKNPRNQKAVMYSTEKIYLKEFFKKLIDFYKSNISIPNEEIIKDIFGDKEFRIEIVNILMALASDKFITKLDNLNSKKIHPEYKKLLEIAKNKTEDRARFRRWVMSSNDLLLLGEGIYSLSDGENFSFFRKKIIKE